MKFVWVPSINRFRRTETEVKKEKLAYEVVEFETDKDSLIDRFNAYEEQIEQLRGGFSSDTPPAAEPQEPAIDATSIEPPRALVPAPAPTPVPTPSITVTQVEEWILDFATPGQVENLFACLGTRFHEMRKQITS